MKATAPEQCWGTRGTRPQTPASFLSHLPQAGGSAAPRLHLGAPCPAHTEPPPATAAPPTGISSRFGERLRLHTRYGGSWSIPTPRGHTGFVSLVLLLHQDTACRMSAPSRILGQALLRLGLQH